MIKHLGTILQQFFHGEPMRNQRAGTANLCNIQIGKHVRCINMGGQQKWSGEAPTLN